MKILVFTYTYGAPTLTFIFEELKGLAKKNEVCIAYVQRESPDRLLFSNEVQLNRSSSGFRRWLFYFMRNKNFGYYQKDGVFKKELNRLIVSFKPDVIHCHFGPDFLFLYDNLEFDIPVSVVFHGYDASQLLKIYPSYVKKLKKVSKDKSVQAVYVSKFLRDNIRSHGIKFLREAVVYLGIDTNKFLRESDLTPNCKVFLQVSSFREKKGHEYTV
ncbi:MAG: glycosyltransferase family 4 protein, partial [Bacteroidetes bacterium]|nr:glycosyltransferase family 4 protein [Bacteroidota bacterium]